MRLTLSCLICLAVFAAGGALAAKKDKPKDSAAKPALIGTYGEWKVYHSGEGKAKICYTLAEPKAREPAEAERGKAYAFISQRPAEHVRNEISFVMGTELAAEAKEKDKEKPKKGARKEAPATPTLTLGEDEYDLAPKGSDLWIKNPAEEAKIIEAMRKGGSVVIKAAARKGGRLSDTYALAGFRQAIDKAVKDCAGN